MEKLQEREEKKKKDRLRNKFYRSSNVAGPPKREKEDESESFEEYGSSEEYSDEYEEQDTGPHNLRSFLPANSTQNYFLIVRMLSFF